MSEHGQRVSVTISADKLREARIVEVTENEELVRFPNGELRLFHKSKIKTIEKGMTVDG